MDAPSRFSLTGKVALVTGSSAGIGRAIARAMAEAGADLIVTSRGAERLEDARREIKAPGGRVLAVPADVSLPEDVTRLVERTRAEYGRGRRSPGAALQ